MKDNRHGFTVTERDKLMNVWRGSMDLVRDFEELAHETKEQDISDMFSEYAEDEGIHASWLRKQIEKYDTSD